MKRTLLCLMILVMPSFAWAADPASYFAGRYKVLSKDVKIDTFPKGDHPLGPDNLESTTSITVEDGDGGYAIFADTYDYPLATLRNSDLSQNGNTLVETYAGNAQGLRSTLLKRTAFADGSKMDADRLVTLQRTSQGVRLRYDYSQHDVLCSGGCSSRESVYRSTFLLKKVR